MSASIFQIETEISVSQAQIEIKTHKKADKEIKAEKRRIAQLKVLTGAKDSFLGLLNPKVKQLAGGVATEQEDLKAAGETHAKEARDFIAGEKEAEISASQAQITVPHDI